MDYVSQESALFGAVTSRQVIRPLWFIFAGGLLCCITFGVTAILQDGNNWNLHLPNQPIGAALIAIGVWQLGRIDIDLDYTRLMHFIFVVAILQAVATTADFFPYPKDPLIVLARIVINLASIVGAIGFCLCMRWFCLDMGLRRSAKKWMKTMVVICCSCSPIAFVQLYMLLVVLKAVESQPSATVQTGWPWFWWYLLVIALMVGPPVAFLLNILQMRREIERRATL